MTTIETCGECGATLTPERASDSDNCEPCSDAIDAALTPVRVPTCYCGAAFVEQVFMETAKCANGHYGRFR